MESAVRNMGGVWPPYRGISPKDYSPGHLFSAAGVNRGKPSSSDKLYMSNGPDEPCTLIGTRTEFDQCTARLRNEPSFAGAPDWAKAKAQDNDGEWYWYGVEPEIAHNCFANSAMIEIASRGEVIGDWRDTLRLRPEEMEVKKNQMNATEAVYGFAGWLTSRKEKVCFSSTTEASTAAELAGEFCSVNELPEISDNWPDNLVHPKSKEVEEADWQHRGEFPDIERDDVIHRINELQGALDDVWYKRGEYPPAGTVCEVLYVSTWRRTKIIGWNNDNIVITTEWDDTYSYDGLLAEPWMFRPIQTERGRWIEKAQRHFTNDCDVEASLLSMYNDGLAKMPEEK